MLDRVQCQLSDTSMHLLGDDFEWRHACTLNVHACMHLLGDDFEGVFTSADLALKAEIAHLVAELEADPLARSAEAYDEVRSMLEALGGTREADTDG